MSRPLAVGIASGVDDHGRSALHRLGQGVVPAVADHDVCRGVNDAQIRAVVRQSHPSICAGYRACLGDLARSARSGHEVKVNVRELAAELDAVGDQALMVEA
jgi:hypothetical protein